MHVPILNELHELLDVTWIYKKNKNTYTHKKQLNLTLQSNLEVSKKYRSVVLTYFSLLKDGAH